MDLGTLQAWWCARQGLDGSLEGKSPAGVLERSGWARSVGGMGPYLSLFARAGVSREMADAAAAALHIHELPSARGCTYVLPARDFALGLKVSQGTADEAEMKTARKLGVTDKEIATLRTKVVAALRKGPLPPEALKEALGSAVRNLGEEGKKKGVTTTLPLALGYLQTSGEIRRVPSNGRLDTQRYLYTLWEPNPLSGFPLSREEALQLLARRYFQWTGPAALAEFQWFSGLSGKAAKEAVAPLGLVPIAENSERLLLPEDLDALRAFKKPRSPQYVLVSSLDAAILLRRNVESLLGGEPVLLLKGITDLPSNAILDRGSIAGLWEYDVESQSIVWKAFGKKDKAMEAAVKKTEAFVRDQLGDARSFSLDTPKSRAARIAALH